MGGTRVELKSKTGVEPKSKKAPLRIGLLVDGPRASKYAYDLAKWAQDRPDLDITHLIVHALPATESPASAGKLSKAVRLLQSAGPVRTIAHLAASAMTRVIVMIERILLNRSPRYREHLAEFDLSPIIPNTIVVKPIVSKSGFVYRFAGEDVDSLKALSLDLMVRCGSGILRGEILRAARFGIISFHHADNRVNRWLFTNIDRSGDDDYFELAIFSADSPLSDQWIPHPQNPIFVDAARARNAGLVKDGDRFFRLAQSQGFDFYGQKALLNEIVTLDETNYREALVSEISPGFRHHLVGSHHLHSNGKVTVFDSLRLTQISQ